MSRAPVRVELVAGGLAGMVAGLVVASVQLWQGMMSVDFLGGGASAPGIGAALVLSAVGGVGLGALAGGRPAAPTTSVPAGVVIGMLWWTLQWLTLVPLFAGRRVTWSITEADATFGFLAGSMVYGGLTALLMYAAAAGWRRGRPDETPSMERAVRRIVIVGGGFAGVATAQRLERRLARRDDVVVTLVSTNNYLLFTPMLAGVAGGSLHGQHIGAPLRAACPRTDVRRASVEAVDPASRTVVLRQGDGSTTPLRYDHLVLAVGAVPNYRGLTGVARHAFALKTLDDAERLRDHVIALLEQADSDPDAARRRQRLTFVVAGGGFAGAELVAELCDMVHGVRRFYPRIVAPELRFVLIHSQDRILPELDPRLADHALQRLAAKGVEFILSTVVADATAHLITLGDGRTIESRTLVWTAGNEPSPLVARLGLDRERNAIRCEATLQVSGHDDIWALGDCAAIPDPDAPGRFYPPTAQHALREGRGVADNVVAALYGRPPTPFRFRTIALLVALGHQDGAAQVRGRLLTGRLAWAMWRGIYLSKLPGPEKRIRVALDWILDVIFPRDIVLTRTTEAAPAAARDNVR